VKPGIFERARTSVPRNGERCVETHGNHREHLLHKSNKHRPYLSRHWFPDIQDVEWDLFAHLNEYHIPIKPVNLFLSTCIIYNEDKCY
jgi:hypothetical protein